MASLLLIFPLRFDFPNKEKNMIFQIEFHRLNLSNVRWKIMH